MLAAALMSERGRTEKDTVNNEKTHATALKRKLQLINQSMMSISITRIRLQKLLSINILQIKKKYKSSR